MPNLLPSFHEPPNEPPGAVDDLRERLQKLLDKQRERESEIAERLRLAQLNQPGRGAILRERPRGTTSRYGPEAELPYARGGGILPMARVTAALRPSPPFRHLSRPQPDLSTRRALRPTSAHSSPHQGVASLPFYSYEAQHLLASRSDQVSPPSQYIGIPDHKETEHITSGTRENEPKSANTRLGRKNQRTRTNSLPLLELSEDEEASVSRSPKWAAGADYGPILQPIDVLALDLSLELSPLITHFRDKHPGSFQWDMSQKPSSARGSPECSEDLADLLSQPATFPRISALRLVSPSFPWLLRISAKSERAGVTCGDVLNGIYEQLRMFLRPIESTWASDEFWSSMVKAHCARHGISLPPPDEEVCLPPTSFLQRIDWLLENTSFRGLEVDEDYVLSRHQMQSITFKLECGQNRSVPEAGSSGAQACDSDPALVRGPEV